MLDSDLLTDIEKYKLQLLYKATLNDIAKLEQFLATKQALLTDLQAKLGLPKSKGYWLKTIWTWDQYSTSVWLNDKMISEYPFDSEQEAWAWLADKLAD